MLLPGARPISGACLGLVIRESIVGPSRYVVVELRVRECSVGHLPFVGDESAVLDELAAQRAGPGRTPPRHDGGVGAKTRSTGHGCIDISCAVSKPNSRM